MLGRLLLLLGRPIFRCCLSLREGKPPYTQERIPCCHVGFLSNNGSRKTCTLPHTLGEQEKPIQNRGPSISECLCRRQLFFPSEKVAKFERLIRVKERPPPIPDNFDSFLFKRDVDVQIRGSFSICSAEAGEMAKERVVSELVLVL